LVAKRELDRVQEENHSLRKKNERLKQQTERLQRQAARLERETDQADSRRWREQMERYHYLGWRVPFGAHLRYRVRHRDQWIGWSDEQRRRSLQAIVNNGRFLILPWVRVKGLASKILARSAKQMPPDWEIRYRAAHWIHIGQTTGRGRMDRMHQAHRQAVKDIHVYPLVRAARQRLYGGFTR
jgi:hypothetical protein